MSSKIIHYRKGYKYQLAEEYVIETGIRPYDNVLTQFISLDTEGQLTIRSGYCWDGPSGPTADTPSSMRGSLVHDALYQLIRNVALPRSARDAADELLYRICVEDGMWKWRAWMWRRAVKKFAAGAADPRNRKPILLAP